MDHAATAQPTCPVCGTAISEAPRVCERCDTPHHGDCWDYAGGCAIFGCARECVPHSRESSLSSSSYSSYSSPSPPAFHRWFWLYRLHAYALSIVGAGFILVVLGQLAVNLLGSVGPDLGLSDRFMFTTLPFSFFVLLWQAVALVTSLAFLVTVTTVLPARFLRHRAEGSLATGLTPPREGVLPVLERLDTGPVGSALLRFLGLAQPWAVLVLPLGLGLMACAVLISALGASGGLSNVVLRTGMVGALGAWPILDAHDRMVWVETLQHRVAASFKGAKEGRP